ncbi:hypothetical protein [Caldinitratiruptor microaerophilus]|uniref:NnrS family protein n=1 Tax=Caldinitratiruptor microaerophilus TaxID=671077 RepID=A0AA35CML1_9FIRM|nr:hypothetical protein [Caldinitratiruptor microaerophilus]BDG60070.1 hypothetical protein caldi_11600 [Caldinitratiruptor microaerophilus]
MQTVFRPRPARLPVAAAMAALLAALWVGLARLGWLPAEGVPGGLGAHGPLIILGFLGTLISLERAVALGRRLPYLAPILTGTGAVLYMVPAALRLGEVLMTAGGLGLVGTFVLIYRIQPSLHAATMGAGAALWAIGGALWLAGLPVYRVVPWWAGFLVLTILGERVELSRMGQPTRWARLTFVTAVAIFVAGLIVSVAAPVAGVRLAGVGLFLQALWLVRYDIARRTVRLAGLTRFMAVCLLAGYAWLGAAGLLWIRFAGSAAGAAYDAMLHALFLGFVMSMIFGHAPVIFPAVLGTPVRFTPRFYLHLALLHGSAVLRLVGDLALLPGVRNWGGLLNVAAVLLFLIQTALAARPARTGA